MHERILSSTLTIASLAILGCSDSVQEQSPGEVLARDSSLATGVRQADTSAFADAAADAPPLTPDLPKRTADSTGAATSSRMRPAPATIHPEPLHRPAMPPSSPRRADAAARQAPSPSKAAEILRRVPGSSQP